MHPIHGTVLIFRNRRKKGGGVTIRWANVRDGRR
jgi:hypothetical protein